MTHSIDIQHGMRVNFARLFHQLVSRFGNKEALVNVERDRRYTFAELHELTNRIANMMSAVLGLRLGDRYLLILRNDNLSLMSFWTIMKAEAAAVFVNVSDPAEEHFRQVDFVQPKCVFIESGMLPVYHEYLSQRRVAMVAMDGVPDGLTDVGDFWALVRAASPAEPVCEREVNEQPAFYRFTGGTTGVPKCAAYAYRHFEQTWLSWAGCEDHVFTSATKTLHIGPLSHGTLLVVPPTFFAGGCNITQNKADLTLWCEVVERFKITTTLLVPTMLYRLLALEGSQQWDLSSLSALIYGAAPMSAAKLAQLQGRFGNVFIQVYGSTESFGIVTYLSKREHVGEGAERRLESCGRPVSGAELMIADDQGYELPRGEVGELWHRHRGVIRGYYRNAQATSEEFIDGWWKSGDLGRMDTEGYCFIVDRKKDMIITGGFNVYAIEVEAALSSHADVLMCAVVGIPHPEWGEALHAEVIRRVGATAPAEDLIAHVKRAIGGHKAPKSIVFVSDLPVSSVGKVLRKDVRAKYWQAGSRQVN